MRLVICCGAAHLRSIEGRQRPVEKDKIIMALSYRPMDTAAELDLITIEREARALQAQAIAGMFRALLRGIASLFTRRPAQRAA